MIARLALKTLGFHHMLRHFLAGLAILCACLTANAQEAGLQPILQEHQATIAKSSRKTIKPAIDAIAASGLPQASRRTAD